MVFRSQLKPTLHDYQTPEFTATVDAGKKSDLLFEIVRHQGHNARTEQCHARKPGREVTTTLFGIAILARIHRSEYVLNRFFFGGLMGKLSTILALALCLSGVMLRAADEAKPAGKSDKELLQGTWRVVGVVRNGEAMADDDLKETSMSMRFSGDIATLAKGDQSKDASFTIDEAKTPKQIVITPKDGPQKDKPRTNIYQLDGDTLKLAFRIGDDNATPPANFAQGEGLGMMTLERQKP